MEFWLLCIATFVSSGNYYELQYHNCQQVSSQEEAAIIRWQSRQEKHEGFHSKFELYQINLETKTIHDRDIPTVMIIPRDTVD